MFDRIGNYFNGFHFNLDGFICLLIGYLGILNFTLISELHNIPMFFEILLILSINLGTGFLIRAYNSFRRKK